MLREWLKREHKLGAICYLHSFSRRAGILSGSHAFVVSSSLKRSITSSTVTSICDRRAGNIFTVIEAISCWEKDRAEIFIKKFSFSYRVFSHLVVV